tara:strand:- start:123 stop:536 length:414 start_codon:yes stop_codon:yes gene_type:complete
MWNYNEDEFDPSEEFLKDYVGFVYRITEKDTGRMYLGKKLFWRPKTLPVNKTRKRKVKLKVISDWQKYYGSSEHLKESIAKTGVDNYHREILKLCRTKGECSYYEAKLQFENDVLLDDMYYNAFIGCKIHAKHLPKD